MIISGLNYKMVSKKVTSLLRIKVREGISLDVFMQKGLDKREKVY